MLEALLHFLREHPALLFAAIAILPGFAVPSSPLLVLAGVVWGPTPTGCALALAAIGLNICWTHILAAGPARKIIIRLIGDRLARFRPAVATSHWKIVCALRLPPGVPLFIQNYGIGLLGAPLRLSLALAIPTTAVHVCGFVLTGGAILEGRIAILLLGITLLILATLIIHTLRKRLA